MFVRSAKWLTVAALVFTLGGHWAVLQTVAWVGMTINYSAEDSLSTALSKTFDGDHPCNLCKVVKAGKKAERKSEAKVESKKLDSFVASSFQFYFPPAKQTSVSLDSTILLRTETPPSPPPRLA